MKKKSAQIDTESALNERQKRFCLEYLKDFNATRAATAAGYDAKDMWASGSSIVRNPKVQTHLAKLVRERNQATKIDIYYVVNKMKEIVEADFIKWADLGKVGLGKEDFEKMPEAIRKMVTAIDRTETYNKANDETTIRFKFKMMDKTKCLEMLAKHVGAFQDVNITQNNNIQINSFTDMVQEATTKRIKDVNE